MNWVTHEQEGPVLEARVIVEVALCRSDALRLSLMSSENFRTTVHVVGHSCLCSYCWRSPRFHVEHKERVTVQTLCRQRKCFGTKRNHLML